jgi:hypothetical protein
MDNFCCLACSATYGSRKQLAAHTNQCALNSALTDQIFERKRKSDKKKRKEDKRARHHESPRHESPERRRQHTHDADIPEQPEVLDSMDIDEQEELEYIDVCVICSTAV